MSTSRYSGNRRTRPALRVLALTQEVSTRASSEEDSIGESGGALPSGKTSRYSGKRRQQPTLHMLAIDYRGPAPEPEAAVTRYDAFPVLF